MTDKSLDKILLKFSQDFYYINRVLESCSSKEHLINVDNWIDQIFHKWDRMLDGMSEKEYNKKYKNVVVYMTSHLKNKLSSKMSEDNEKKTTENVVVKGFNGYNN